MPAFFDACQILCARPVKFSGLSNFQELRSVQELLSNFHGSWELGAARHPISSAPERVSCKDFGRKKLEKFRKFIYNKRGNININIFNIKLDPCQISPPHKKKKNAFLCPNCGSLTPSRGVRGWRAKERGTFLFLSERG